MFDVFRIAFATMVCSTAALSAVGGGIDREFLADLLKVRARPGRRPVENRPGDPEIAALVKAMKAKLPGGIREGRMSAATDASYYAGLGIPIVIFACTGGEPHSVREWGSLKSLDDYADFFTAYLAERTSGGIR